MIGNVCRSTRGGMAVVAVVLLLGAQGVRAEDLKSVARGIFGRAQKTVVTVRLVLKISMGSHDQEQKLEVVGTVIDPSGLTVVPTSAVDPGSVIRAMMRGRGGNAEVKFDSAVTETTIILADGTEVESDVILKDAELDLAFIRPRDQDKPFDAVALKPGKPLPGVLDDVIIVGRYGRAANRTPWVAVTQVAAIVKGPRNYALCGSEASGDALGAVAYGADGSPLGVFVTHFNKEFGSESSRGMAGMIGGGKQNGVIILRAIEDVLEVADQARKMKNPEPKLPDTEPAKPDPKKTEPAKTEPAKTEPKPKGS